MMKKWKKTALGLVSTSALFLAACGGGNTGDQNADKDTNGSGETANNFDGETLKVSIDPMYADYINDLAPKFEKETGATIELEERDMFETLEALPLDGPAGLSPDVMLSPYDRIGGLGMQGHLAEYTLPDDGRYDEIDQQQVMINDKIYGAPFVIESMVLYYNEDLIDKAPATFDELEALTKDEQFAFGSEKDKSVAFLANWVDFYNSYGLLNGFGGYVFGEKGTDPSDVGLNTPDAVKGIEYATHWFKDIWPKGMLDATSAGNFIDDQFTTGKAGAVINGPWAASNYAKSDINVAVSTVPTLPNGEEYQPFAGGKGWVVSEYAQNVDLGKAFLDFVTNEDNMQVLYNDFTKEVPANQMVRKSIIDADEDDLAMAVINQYNVSSPMPNIPEMAEVWVGAETMMFDAGSGNKSPKDSADDSVKVIKDNIDQKY